MNDHHFSKFLSLILRHQPEKLGISLNKQGWTSVSILLERMQQQGKNVDLEQLQNVVANDNKQRYSFSPDGSMIRANQGHSIPIDLGYEAIPPPDILYHGTAIQNLASIKEKGLVKGNRHHVHLSATAETATAVGKRYGHPILLQIKTAEMAAAGHQFFCSENGVWLCDYIPPHFLIYPD